MEKGFLDKVKDNAYWNLAYSCFTFGKVDLVPTVEECTILLHFPRI
ncbi:hypothetical protein Gotri_014462 [Gossypium trilobum]|uniref:Uncharacterized protein n=1 Tax=Gossypium trilobum TaxID=34281 RepID=A0A7J9DWT6_9ROSI|nr:hypothetical protein [Gossypium trilobum]